MPKKQVLFWQYIVCDLSIKNQWNFQKNKCDETYD